MNAPCIPGCAEIDAKTFIGKQTWRIGGEGF